MAQRALNQYMKEKLEAELWAAIERCHPEQFKDRRDGKIEINCQIENSGGKITAKVTFHYPKYPKSSPWAHYEYQETPTQSYWHMVQDWNS